MTARVVLQPIRVLVIGAGPASVDMHLPLLARLRDRDEIVLAVVCDIQPERAAAARRKFGFLEESGDAAAVLERPDIDAVYIFGSAQLHYEYGLKALLAGKHLFVEKPLAPSYAQACEMARAARAHGVVAVAGHNRRFHPSLALIHARAGSVRWRFAEAVFHKPEFGKPPLFGARTWLGANGIHGLDALVFMMGGLPEQLNASASSVGGVQPSAFSAIMRWGDGNQAVFLCNNDAGSRREEYVFHGLGETCTVNGTEFILETGGTTLRKPLPPMKESLAAEHGAFLHAIRSGEEAPHRIEAIAPSLFLAELIEGGFNGPVRLPQPASASILLPRQATDQSILVSASSGLQTALARLLSRYRLVSIEEVRQTSHSRPDITAAILGHGAPPLAPDTLAKLPRLAVVGIAALSLAPYEPEVLLARDIALINASAAYADSVAEFALGLAILGRRRAFISHEIMRHGGWGVRPGRTGLRGLFMRAARGVRPAIKRIGLEPYLLARWKAMSPSLQGLGGRAVQSHELRDSTVGLIGWGANARAFAERLVGARTRVLVYSEHATPSDIQQAGAILASLGEVLAADIVSLHRGLNKDTHHCIGAAELTKLRPGAVLINVARAALIEPAALLARLKQGDIFACLDTHDPEPLGAAHPLRSLPNVFLTSHIAGGSADMHAAAAEEVVRKIDAYLSGQSSESIPGTRLRTMT